MQLHRHCHKKSIIWELLRVLNTKIFVSLPTLKNHKQKFLVTQQPSLPSHKKCAFFSDQSFPGNFDIFSSMHWVHTCLFCTGKPNWKERHSTIDLLLLTSFKNLIFILNVLFDFYTMQAPPWGDEPYWAFPLFSVPYFACSSHIHVLVFGFKSNIILLSYQRMFE
jgi:hypothetical protein